MIIFSNCIGSFVFDEQFQLKDYVLFSAEDAIANTKRLEEGSGIEVEQKLLTQHQARRPDEYELAKILERFGEDIYVRKFRETNLMLTRLKLREAVKPDVLISNAIGEVDELVKVLDVLTKRLREWYAWYNPEFERVVQDNQVFVDSILTKDREALLTELNRSETLGGNVSQENLDPIMACANSCKNLFALKAHLEQYIEQVLAKFAPNIQAVAGSLLAARLIKDTGSLRRLAMMKSSIIQIIGAEKALFRHIRTGAKPPKYGILFTHPLVQKVNKKEQGKAARALADKTAIAAKVDFFKGAFVGDKLKAELEAKFLGIKHEALPPPMPTIPNVDSTPKTVEEWKDGEVREKVIHVEGASAKEYSDALDEPQEDKEDKVKTESKDPSHMEISEDIFKDLEFKE